MWCSDRNHHIVAYFSVDNLLVFARAFDVWDVEADDALCDEEGFVMHFVPVGWWARGSWWEDEFCNSQAVVCGIVRPDVMQFYNGLTDLSLSHPP